METVTALKCPDCGAEVQPSAEGNQATCIYCGSTLSYSGNKISPVITIESNTHVRQPEYNSTAQKPGTSFPTSTNSSTRSWVATLFVTKWIVPVFVIVFIVQWIRTDFAHAIGWLIAFPVIIYLFTIPVDLILWMVNSARK